ncbi:type II secretion system minor pseudopilin GspH [Vibrio genomosp. F10]|uniref:Type II secretion system protein H n=1 Tax=Vibrio genomosp. F10 TaxID=723171 RepID=A0A1B9QVB1_9VIBR|nr:type II secretion system protein GspH [Vibrio genomosp. F10]OEE98193.1 type II secretion system protein GspH [Vibrio genomosp. F10 str. 9ZC157]OEF04515.1 type II secretion system protein GspH [Vibrio genomosp. F10 str. 9ZB36]OEF04621.1 type II secretion system protein GspH [Vibrio genomosp. F10 str. 9ZD137]
MMKYKQQGFTLLEILLVLVVISMGVVTTLSALPDNSQDNAKQQAQALFQRLQLINDEAILSGKDFGLRVDETRSRYIWMGIENGQWKPVTLDTIPEETELTEEGVSIEMTLGGDAWNDKDRLFQPGSLFDEEMFADLEADNKPLPPQIFLFSSGEVTPVSIALYPQNKDAKQDGWQVVIKENGQILLMSPGEQDEQ